MNSFNAKNYLSLLPYLVYGVAAFLTFIVVEEDAFIYFRLAQNMADGYGIVFNRGGEHIESGSSLIWQGMLAVLAMLPVHLVIATKLLGVLFAVLSLWKLTALSRQWIADPYLALLPAILLAGSTPFYYWSHRGLETPLFVFLLLVWVEWVTDDRKVRYWFVPAWLLVCARPEGFLMVLALLPWLWLSRTRMAHFVRNTFLFNTLLFAAGWFAVELWRWYYFHDLVPHPFYLKFGGDLVRPWHDMQQYSVWNGFILLVVLSLPACFTRRAWQKQDFPLWLMLAVTTLWGVLGADWKSFNRQLASWLPWVYLLGVMLASRCPVSLLQKKLIFAILSLYAVAVIIFSPYTSADGQTKWSPALGCIKLWWQHPQEYSANVISATVNPEHYFTQQEPALAGDYIGFNRNATVGRFIQLNYPRGITVVFDQVGQAPWYAGLDKVFIDNTGLTDKTIGYYEFHQRASQSALLRNYEQVLWYLKSEFWPTDHPLATREAIINNILVRKPELILVRERYVEREENSLIAGVLFDPHFALQYRRSWRLNKRDVVYERRDLPIISQVKTPPGALVEPLADLAIH